MSQLHPFFLGVGQTDRRTRLGTVRFANRALHDGHIRHLPRMGWRTPRDLAAVAVTDQLLADAPALEAATLPTLPSDRLGSARDVANVVAFLVSDEAAYINGRVIAVDGGLSAGNATPA